jgi:hypothetical protein
MKASWPKLTVLALFAAYFIRAALLPEEWRLIDGANLIFHEAGHWLLSWGPHWLEIAGGSLFQVLLPLAIAIVAWRQGRPLTAAIVLLWTGQSFINVSVYAGDALHQRLPLIADNAIHDWNHLLWYFGALRHTAAIAAIIRITGWLTILGGLIVGLHSSLEFEADEAKTPPPKTAQAK